jgi:hypothetical protein
VRGKRAKRERRGLEGGRQRARRQGGKEGRAEGQEREGKRVWEREGVDGRSRKRVHMYSLCLEGRGKRKGV